MAASIESIIATNMAGTSKKDERSVQNVSSLWIRLRIRKLCSRINGRKKKRTWKRINAKVKRSCASMLSRLQPKKSCFFFTSALLVCDPAASVGYFSMIRRRALAEIHNEKKGEHGKLLQGRMPLERRRANCQRLIALSPSAGQDTHVWR